MEGKKAYRVLIVDDHPLFRRGVVHLLDLDESFKCVGEAGTYDSALEAVRRYSPDLVILDLDMKGKRGLEILVAIKDYDPSIRVVMMTVSDSPRDLVHTIKSGADGYLLKDLEPSEILEHLHKAVDGVTVLSPSLVSALAQTLKHDLVRAERSTSSLTDREITVLKGISQGFSNKAIAKQLNISDGTVKVHVKHVLKKLKFRTRIEAAIWVTEHDVKLD